MAEDSDEYLDLLSTSEEKKDCQATVLQGPRKCTAVRETTTMTVSYEEKRRQRMEENRKKMEEFNLHQLAHSLKPIKRKYVKKVYTEPSRRSVRMADKTPPNYYKPKQIYVDFFAELQSEYTFKQLKVLYRISIKEEDMIYAANKAKELALSLGSEFPTLVKPITRAATEFSIPGSFCKIHHLDHDDVLTVIDEENKEWQINYRAKIFKFCGGWPKFYFAHQLVVGDALVFQLIKPNTLKVFIIRVNKVISNSYVDEDNGNITP